jgi:hypothetical protein
MKSVRNYIIFITVLFTVTLNAADNYFEYFDKFEVFRIENQFYGESVVLAPDYLPEPFLYQVAMAPPYETTQFRFIKTDSGYYKIYQQYSNKFLVMPDKESGTRLASSKRYSGDYGLWEITLVNPKGLYTIRNKASGLYLCADYSGPYAWNPYMTRYKNGLPIQKKFFRK